MNDASLGQENVRVLPPDQTMKKKLGNANLDSLLSPQVIEQAQQVIVHTSDQFLDDCLEDLIKLKTASRLMKSNPTNNKDALEALIASSFAIKSKAGLGGYDLISVIAKSLHARCELSDDAKLTSSQMSIIGWHVDSIERLLNLKVKGSGGQVGEAILAELNKLVVNVHPAA